MPCVGIVMGSDSDWPLVQKAADTLKAFGVAYEVRVMSAHRTPDVACEYAAAAARRGLKVIIAAAGLAAHLGGVLAAHTVLPVIGIPMPGGPLNGQDALLATVQMPSGIPVATVGIGNATNAALLAVQILGTADEVLRAKFLDHKAALRQKVIEADAKLNASLE
ncbi:MAG: 5-(carboxyamino)imidazole ribonucleotide mutase [Kiritimatiellaeota bacterium]|nr:5-(carboxyamino)imidazole ribonucleotide mutase [Kiritimatiellota bacterium]